MAANKHRGEVEIELAGKKFVMRPTFQCMCEIEAATGLGTFALARRYASFNFGVSDATSIVTAAIKAAGEPAERDKVGEMIMASGLDSVGQPIAEFLTLALGGPARGNGGAADGK